MWGPKPSKRSRVEQPQWVLENEVINQQLDSKAHSELIPLIMRFSSKLNQVEVLIRLG